MYKWLPVNVVGGSYPSRSGQFSSQKTINLIPEANPTGRTEAALMNWHGSIRRLTSTDAGIDRGSCVFDGVLYKVTGTTLYSVNAAFVETSIGTISGANRCIFANDGTNLIIVTGSTAYQYNGTTLSTISDPDLETPDSVAVLNNQLIYDGNNARWVVATAGDPDDIPDINYAVAESAGDDLVRVYVFNQTLYLMGENTIETWFNSGSGNPPFTRIDGGIIETLGLYALHSVVNTSEYLYFLASDKNVYRITGYQAENITPPAQSNLFFSLSSSDAIGTTMNIDSQSFYVIAFPSDNQTWVYSEDLKNWFQICSGEDCDRHIINSYQFVYGKRLITDYRNGNVLELDKDTFVDDTTLVQVRQRDTVNINGYGLGIPTQRLIMSSFRLMMEVGVGIESGQGSEPKIYIGTSVDGGKTFDFTGNPYVSIGESGNYNAVVQFDKVLEFTDLVIRLKITDPVFVSIHGAAIFVDKAGDW